MTPMTSDLKAIVNAEIGRAWCSRNDEGGCSGRLEVSHPLGRKVQKRWMFHYLCTQHHRGELKNNAKDKYIVYKQADDELIKQTFPKTFKQHLQEKKYLTDLYEHPPHRGTEDSLA